MAKGLTWFRFGAACIICFLLGLLFALHFNIINGRQSEQIAMMNQKIEVNNATSTKEQAESTTVTSEQLDVSVKDLPEEKVQIETKNIDLNDDGQNELMERRYSSMECGASNCPTAVYSVINGRRTALLDVVAQSFPEVLSSKTLGYRDLKFGPDAVGRVTVWKWNGTEYK